MTNNNNIPVKVISAGNSGCVNVLAGNGAGVVSYLPSDSYYAELSKTYALQSEGFAAELENLIQQYMTGMTWIEVKQSDWSVYGNGYKTEINGIFAVCGVFKGSWNQKQLVSADVTITDTKSIIYSDEALNGYILGSYNIVRDGNWVTLDVLYSMFSTRIVDITE